MVIQKVWKIKDERLEELKKKDNWQDIHENTLFMSLDDAVSMTEFAADNFASMVEISFNDGDFASLCTVDELDEEYKKMLDIEPYEIEDIPRKEGEAYFSKDFEPPVSLPMEKIKELVS